MQVEVKFFFVCLLLIAVASIFVPIVTNPHPKECNNYSDTAGGYYTKCKDEYISLYAKWKLPKEQ